MRKLGIKNLRIFMVLTLIILIIISLFVYFIKYATNQNNQEYLIKKESIILNEENEYISLEENANLKKYIDGYYYLKNNMQNNYKVGRNAIVYNEEDYKMYIYGTAYLINSDGSIEKTNGSLEIIKANSPYFYKLSDRKYLFVDKKIFSSDESINTTTYLLVTLDKQGNATLTNHQISIKTIHPLILKGSIYDFDVVHEKLIIGEKEIDLKNIIGSSNEYQDKVENEKEEDETQNTENNNKNNVSSYYDDYLKQIVTNFNNLQNSLQNSNAANQDNQQREDVYLDLTRWVALTKLTSTATSITVDYNVFDPNNEYSQVFLTVSSSNTEETMKYILSKEQTSYTIRGLSYDNEYTITLNYVLASSIDENNTVVTKDIIKMKTKKPQIDFKITKITLNKIYYTITFDETYQIDSGTIALYSDDQKLEEQNYVNNMKTNNIYTGYFEYTSLGYLVELKFENLTYNGSLTDLQYQSKYINE